MKAFIAGEWVDRGERIEVRNPFDGQVVDTVPKANAADAERALAAAVEGARVMRRVSAQERYQILRRAADLMHQRRDQLGRLISSEEGKILSEGMFEVARATETMVLSAEEAKRLAGEVLPLDGSPGGAGTLGFTLRIPCGVVVAITPFNFPLNLVCHKLGPALAAGNAVVLKPASDTPLSALALVEILLEAGLPPLAVSCLVGPGAIIGDLLCKDERVRKITFTGSREVGEHITQVAGLKRITMELGANCPLIVMPDADLEQVAKVAASNGLSNAGQVCISAQRLIAHDRIYGDFLDALRSQVAGIAVGNQLDAKTGMGPMIRESDAARVGQWIDEAVEAGAALVCGGKRRGTLFEPTIVADVRPEMRISRQELFGPALAVSRAMSIEEAIAQANDTQYGLSAGIFTRDIDWAMRFAREVECGNLHINWGPQWRADMMPYGGLKQSGFGKEGPKYAIEEMTELKAVVFHGV